MTSCSYCRTLNADDEHRCRRCGRRLSEDARPLVTGALATQPLPVRRFPEVPAPEPHAQPPARRVPTQPSLFADRPQPKVIPFESFAAPRPVAPAPKAPARTHARRPSNRTPDTQGTLDFLPPTPQATRKLKTTVEAVIYCDAPVATKMHRTLAAAIDLSMVLIAWGLLLGAFHFGGGDIVFNKVTLAVFGGTFAATGLFYGLLWALANTESPGKRWTRLRLTNFDGFPPDATQRFLRFAGACLGFCAGGLGMFWAVADEESLGWHDHISKTFLTLQENETNFVRQR